MNKWLKLTYARSSIGASYGQKRTVKALGFRKLHQNRIVPDSPSLQGMLRSVSHLIRVEPAEAPAAPFPEDG